ncbi:MAG TPA: ABC transporter substrate-binding protein, partial [Casimicrobiaceae bacterium]|nr:ABC transporter substrate-binding protein [Casimicrobiaceae bacterium]
MSLAAPAIVRAQARKPIKVAVGRQPWAAGNSPVTAFMMANKTFEKFGAELGYDITPDYRDYPSAAPMVEAFVSKNLDFGMWGNTPIVRLIAQK